jgi:hypothetical protein
VSGVGGDVDSVHSARAEAVVNTFYDGWWLYWQLLTGGLGWRAWAGGLVAALASSAAYELLKAVAIEVLW